MTALQAACAGAQRTDGERRSIVNVERQFGEALAGEGKLLEVLAADAAHAQRLGADARLFGQNTRGELVRAHFEAEEGHRRPDRVLYRHAVRQIAAEAVCRIERNIGDKRGLAHAGAPGEDDEVAVVEAADLLVDRGQASGLARDMAARKQRLLDHLERNARRRAEALRLVAGLCAFGHGIERGFGLLDLLERRDSLAGVHRASDEIAPDSDQLAQQGQIVDLLGQFLGRKEALPISRQPCEIGGAAKFLETFVRLEIGLQGDRGDHRLAVDQGLDAFVDPAMDRSVEVLGAQRRGQFFQNPVVDQHRAEEGSLGLDVRGKRGGGGPVGLGLAQGDRLDIGHAALVEERGAGGKRQTCHGACG